MTSSKNIVVLQSTLMNKPVQLKLKELFTQPFEHKIVSEKVISDYSDHNQVHELFHEVREKIMDIVRSVDSEDELDIYVISSGGVLHSSILVDMLNRCGVSFKFLSYDTKTQGYVIIDPEEYFGDIGK